MADINTQYTSNGVDPNDLESLQLDEYKNEILQFSPIPVVVGVFMLVIGITGNLITIGCIIYTKRFHNPTFAIIALLAVADFVVLAVRGTAFLVWCSGSSSLIISFHLHLSWIFFITINSSNLHVVILARLRYQQTADPLRSLTISIRDMVKLSLLAWITSSIIGIPYAVYTYHLYMISLVHMHIIEITCIFLILLEILIPVLIYHYLKVSRLRRGIRQRQQVINNMSVMVTIIISMQIIICTIQFAIHGYLTYFTFNLSYYQLKITYIVFHAVRMLNHAINPILYFFSAIFYRTCSVSLSRGHVFEEREQNEEAETQF